MPVYSMTGFGHASASDANTALDIDLRSVNSRFLDLTLKLPDELRQLETLAREQLSAALSRGKVELRVNVQRNQRSSGAPNLQSLPDVLALEQAVLAQAQAAKGLSVHELLTWCERLGAAGQSAQPSEAADPTAAFGEGLREAIKALRAAQAREGQNLAAALLQRVEGLSALANQAEPLIPQAVEAQRQRFLARFEAAYKDASAQTPQAGSSFGAAAQERALSEAVAYAIRIDVAEELSRLRSHLGEITRLLQRDGEAGKRLEFLIQELHRECNTLGSKSTSIELTQISVEMKVLVEQMREQVQNLA